MVVGLPSSGLSADRTFELTFKPGALSTVMSEGVVRGDRDQYLFKAQAGQRVSIAITAFEDNATFELFCWQNGRWRVVPATAASQDTRGLVWRPATFGREPVFNFSGGNPRKCVL